jgi:hypothetical protein
MRPANTRTVTLRQFHDMITTRRVRSSHQRAGAGLSSIGTNIKFVFSDDDLIKKAVGTAY